MLIYVAIVFVKFFDDGLKTSVEILSILDWIKSILDWIKKVMEKKCIYTRFGSQIALLIIMLLKNSL